MGAGRELVKTDVFCRRLVFELRRCSADAVLVPHILKSLRIQLLSDLEKDDTA